MPTKLKLYIIGVVATGAIALVATTLLIPVGAEIGLTIAPFGDLPPPAGLVFWCAITLVASALPVRMPRGTMVGVSIAPLIAATILGGPTAVAWVALIGTTEVRELRGRVPWYGTLANHAGIMIPAIVAGLLMGVMGVPRERQQSRSRSSPHWWAPRPSSSSTRRLLQRQWP